MMAQIRILSVNSIVHILMKLTLKRKRRAPAGGSVRVPPPLFRVDREQRIWRLCRVELTLRGQHIRTVCGNISRRGTYVWTKTLPTVGEVVELAITLAPAVVVRVLARVAHVMTPEAAAALGRRPGAGFHFIEQGTPACAAIGGMLEQATDDVATPPVASRVLVADDNTRFLDRLATALSCAGFEVATALDGVAALEACQTGAPSLVIATDTLPLLDGWALAERMRDPIARHELALLLLSDCEADVARLAEHGLDPAIHWCRKPFTDDELCSRVRELAHGVVAQPPPGLRVSLSELALGTVLAFLERERKSGVATARHGGATVRLHIGAGRIVGVEAPGSPEPYAKLLEMLDWDDGELEFRACEVSASDDVDCSISRLLFEHASLAEDRDTAVRSVDTLVRACIS